MGKKPKNFGQVIREERKKRNIKLHELSNKLNITPSYLRLIEVGERGKNINIDLLLRIAFILNITTDYLLGREDVNKLWGNDEEYEVLLSLYRSMSEEERKKIISIAKILIK